MPRKRLTIADVRANKGKCQYTMMRVETWEELAAAEDAGIDMVSVLPEMLIQQQFRHVAPSLFAVPGKPLYEMGTADDILRWAFQMINAGADAVYCAASFPVVRKLADEAVPVIGHVGLIPSKCTWTGGFRAVGKTAAQAMKVWDMCRRYEEAGAFGVEIEVVPPAVTAAISERTSLFMVSMGAAKVKIVSTSLRATCLVRTPVTSLATQNDTRIWRRNSNGYSAFAYRRSSHGSMKCSPVLGQMHLVLWTRRKRKWMPSNERSEKLIHRQETWSAFEAQAEMLWRV